MLTANRPNPALRRESLETRKNCRISIWSLLHSLATNNNEDTRSSRFPSKSEAFASDLLERKDVPSLLHAR